MKQILIIAIIVIFAAIAWAGVVDLNSQDVAEHLRVARSPDPGHGYGRGGHGYKSYGYGGYGGYGHGGYGHKGGHGHRYGGHKGGWGK